MTELNSEARALLNSGHGVGEASDAELRRVLAAFEAERGTPEVAKISLWNAPRRMPTRVTRVLLAAVVLSASLAAAASWSQVFQHAPSALSRAPELPAASSPGGAAARAPARHVGPAATAETELSPIEGVVLDPKPDMPAPASSPELARANLHAAADDSNAPARPGAVRPSSLDAELELIVAARDALRAFDYRRAAELASEHQVRFPAGAMAQEGSAILALAECKTGQPPVHARGHIARWPQSFFNERIKKACGELTSSVQIPSRPTTHFARETPEGSF